jgi:hypothetical protein
MLTTNETQLEGEMNGSRITFDVRIRYARGGRNGSGGDDRVMAETAAPGSEPGVYAEADEEFVNRPAEYVRGRRTERRRHRRYVCALALRYRCTQNLERAGFSVDISAGGISADLPETLQPGSSIDVTLDWPGQADHKVMIHGRVLRSRDGRTAISIDKYAYIAGSRMTLPGSASI